MRELRIPPDLLVKRTRRRRLYIRQALSTFSEYGLFALSWDHMGAGVLESKQEFRAHIKAQLNALIGLKALEVNTPRAEKYQAIKSLADRVGRRRVPSALYPTTRNPDTMAKYAFLILNGSILPPSRSARQEARRLLRRIAPDLFRELTPAQRLGKAHIDAENIARRDAQFNGAKWKMRRDVKFTSGICLNKGAPVTVAHTGEFMCNGIVIVGAQDVTKDTAKKENHK